MDLLKMYKRTLSHEMLIAATDALMQGPLENSVKLIAWTTHFFKSLWRRKEGAMTEVHYHRSSNSSKLCRAFILYKQSVVDWFTDKQIAIMSLCCDATIFHEWKKYYTYYQNGSRCQNYWV